MDTRRTFVGQIIAAILAFFHRMNPNRVLAEASTRPDMLAELKQFMRAHPHWTGADYQRFMSAMVQATGVSVPNTPPQIALGEGLLP